MYGSCGRFSGVITASELHPRASCNETAPACHACDCCRRCVDRPRISGSLQVVNQIAPTDKRAAVVSSYFVCCFIGNALPVIGVGVLSSLTNTTVADIAFSCVIAAFAVVALIFGPALGPGQHRW